MYKQKKIIFLIIVVSILYSGCGEKKDKIMVWSSLRPVEQVILDSLLQDFGQDYPGYEFSQLFYSTEEARINFIIAALAGKGPDLLHGASDNVGPLADLELIYPLENLFEEDYLNSFLQKPFAANTFYKGHLYQIADRIGNHLCLVYNKDLIDQPPQTMSELVRMGKKLTADDDGDGRPDRYALAWNYTEPYFAVPFIGGYGGWIVDEAYNPTLNTKATEKAAQFIYDLANTYQIIPKECDYEIANALFKDRLSAMIINGPWSWGTYLANNMNIGIARIPKIDETGLWPTPIVSPLGYCININITGEKLEVIKKLVRYLTGKEVQLHFSKEAGIIPSRIDAYEHPAIMENELLKQAIDQMKVGRLMPVVTKMRWIWDAMRPGYQGIFTGQVTPQQAAVEMQQRAERLIEENL
jgi:maltose-binding protein MalE